jgi:LacI family transcriptional regulator
VSTNFFCANVCTMVASMKQIARECGVAISTVSRALNGSTSIRPEVREQIVATAQRLGYRPNNAARALRSRSSRTVGVVLPDMLNTFYAKCTAILQDQFEAQGYGIRLAVTGNSVDREREALARLESERIDGLVIVPTARRWQDHIRGVPAVQMNRHTKAARADIVQSDEAYGARELVSHLLNLGHRRIAVLIGDKNFSTTQDRMSGVRDAYDSSDAFAGPTRVLFGTHSRSWGAQAFDDLWTAGERPTAIFAAGSEIALGVLHRTREMGVSIPEDISLVCFGDPEWFLVSDPPLTTFEQPVREVGMIAAQLLLGRMGADEAADASHVRVSGRVIVRESTTAPPE